ncbi:peptidoglycan DD-metalloendopeptidase family protein [Pseudodesulfovibrio thermohalotolerans]|uniref:murein hydrolase activator EnvC family protein n=1 Tax=Pseudodesulfovibrio thermohalotolerans TaxID=2880651 RepID=UPI0024424B37|nr:peptidoglycan DD-metalloendopeptidase family protein [Pseudodesulfovibrio thermohalotolerans]WFS60946.1 peptidoglycan DD-metalloendopeptidase family protein [Pseudodesulfovibrio thermohalotolerans]
MRKLLAIITCCVILLPSVALGQARDEVLSESLQKEHQKADENEQKVRDLTKKAGRISTRLADIGSEVTQLKGRIKEQEKTLASIHERERLARQEYLALEKDKERISLELSGLMRTLWPVHMQNVRSRFNGVEDWAMFDRRFNWLADIYAATSRKLDEAKTNSERIAENLENQRRLAEAAEKQLSQVNKSKDKLLDNQYALRRNLKKVNREKESAEAELTAILGTIADLKYQLQSQKTKRFALYKSALPWPVRGRVVSSFNLKATPPVRGLAIGAAEGSTVQSVFWGKVVHNDTLRGFGRVVIIYHGYNYYSLYAYLSDTFVRNGQEVEKNEPLGTVGYFPKVDGAGLYFELRFHQKPINPETWLTATR